MNKLVMKNYDVKGNVAFNPKRKIDGPNHDKQYESLRRSKIERKNRLQEQQKASRKAATQVILLILVLGLITIWRDSKVYNLQNQLSITNKQIKDINSENEALRIEIIKSSSLENIKTIAENNLKMSVPEKEDIVKAAVTEDYFKDDTMLAIKQKKQDKNLLAKIKDALF
ncbi:hypothetical protein CPJCM30710_06540 [Clostridium polyendosporum]|uniref:Cell division protein FtsL n=1 Tax=Clostridium polyendosporum TaxID=69208 RepID=A0A919RYN9_9CLOT|nr:cell division protein FtsL [Clostridium polyendosporum]GIM27988.1 hypothetical protein CPJCM30710_06540 [Clostridium polyendosporum]